MKYKTKAAAKAQLTRQINKGLIVKGEFEVIGTVEFGFYIERVYKAPLIDAEEKYSQAVVTYFVTVYEANLMRYKFIKNKVWRMRHQNPTEYKQACDLLGVESLFKCLIKIN